MVLLEFYLASGSTLKIFWLQKFMTITELLETVRRVELRTNRLVNGTMVGAYLSHFKGRGMGLVWFGQSSACQVMFAV